MDENQESPSTDYPLGRGYGHDYMRGGEVFGGYGYSERQEYERRRGELFDTPESAPPERGNPSLSPDGQADGADGDSGLGHA